MGTTRPLAVCLAAAALIAVSHGVTVPDDSANKLDFTVYVPTVNFDPSISYNDNTTVYYQQFHDIILEIMSDLGGEMVVFKVYNGAPCVAVYVEWIGQDNSKVVSTFSDVSENGVKVGDQMYEVSFKGCSPDDPTNVPIENKLAFTIYVSNLNWEDGFLDDQSSAYGTLKAVVEMTLGSLGGSLEVLKASKNYDCIKLYIEWRADNPENFLPLIADLKENGISLIGYSFGVSTEPCQPSTDEKNLCPELPPNAVGTCVEECSDQQPCKEGFKCCSNGCGHVCKRVGYAMAVKTEFAVDLPWLLSLKDGSSMEAKDLTDAILFTLNYNFGDAMVAFDIQNFSPFNNMDFSNGTMAVGMMYFAQDLSNEDLFEKQIKVMRTPLFYQSGAHRIIDLKLGRDREGMCGHHRCHGICKHFPSGNQHCSCGKGEIGSSCGYFDCRKDFSSTFPDLTQNHCRTGSSCEKNDDDEYECECQEPYFGKTCKHELCDFLKNPCYNEGNCTGLTDLGQVCQCNPGKGGLFCEENTPDPQLTPCQLKRRLMMFVHRQVVGSLYMLDSMVIPMRKILYLMGDEEYSVPYCLPKDHPTNPGGFYSECRYDRMYGKQHGCACLDSQGEYNYHTYVTEGDCRVFSRPVYPFNTTLYIFNTTYIEDMNNMKTAVYLEIKSQVENFFLSVFGGAFQSMTLTQGNNSCVKMEVKMLIENQAMKYSLASKLAQWQLYIKKEMKNVSQKPCKRPVDPKPVYPTNATLYILNTTWMEDMRNMNSDVYLEIETQVEAFIAGMLGGILQGLKLKPGNDSCVKMEIKLSFENHDMLYSLPSYLAEWQLSVNGEMKHLSPMPCTKHGCFDATGMSMCKNGGKCHVDWYSGHSFCKCMPDHYGEMCEVKLCDYVKPDACNSGKCIGSLEVRALCDCPEGKGGLFCELNQPDRLTPCEESARMGNYALEVLRGERPNDKLTIPMQEWMELILRGEKYMEVPTCKPRDDIHPGEFHYICKYNASNGMKTYDDCFCVDKYGEPNYWHYMNGSCVVYVDNRTDVCRSNPCWNGGSCMAYRGEFYCNCPNGYEGHYCQFEPERRCSSTLKPVTSADGNPKSCETQACPLLFDCEKVGRNQSCCLSMNFLCRMNLCQNGASCAGDFYSGQMCHCPAGKAGLFCEEADTGVKLSPCLIKQRFYSWVMRLLRGTEPMPEGIDAYMLQMILQNLDMPYFLEGLCDTNGAFNARATGVSIYNMSDTRPVCIDSEGNIDMYCKDYICDMMDTNGFKICQNGGKCVGDVRRQLCNCSGTGYHGVICDMPGPEMHNTSECNRSRAISEFAISVLNGSKQIVPNIDARPVVLGILKSLESDDIFVPDCDRYGKFTQRGCAHPLADTSQKYCFCATMSGEMIGEMMDRNRPPRNCSEYENDKHCPKEWGPHCQKPEWWCSDKVQCHKDEKCYERFKCHDQNCHQGEMEHKCVPKEIDLPCEKRPCRDNPYKMCSPCGEGGHCYHINKEMETYGMGNAMRGQGHKNDSMEDDMGKSDDDDDDMMGGRKNYMCECPEGKSGEHCEIFDDVCDMLPKDLCDHGCIGDADHGRLCRCPKGFSGLLCNKPAHTQCEVEKMLFDDALDILRGKMWPAKYNTEFYQNLVRLIANFTDEPVIPKRQCTKNGVYEKLQCNLDMYTLNVTDCHCVNGDGEYVSSNTKPYIDYPICTGPADYRSYKEGICAYPICLNGGECVFDPYNGKMCECPDGYHGLFCQHQGTESDEPVSFCNFMEESFNTAQRMALNQSVLRTTGFSPDMYIRLTTMMLGTENRTTRGIPRHLTAIKAECNAFGGFENYLCDANLLTGEIIACYCVDMNGPLIGTEAPDAKSLKCSADRLPCRELDRCRHLQCEHGYRMDLFHCPICECKTPCEGKMCMRGERCVVKHHDCNRPGMGKCSKGVCMPTRKPGMCPGHDASFLSSIIGGAIGHDHYKKNQSDAVMPPDEMEGRKCHIECVDDADCEGQKKCCGLCGNICVNPIEAEHCEDERNMAMEKMELIIETRKPIDPNVSMSLYMTVFHLRMTKELWIPNCDGQMYKPAQCKYNVSEWEKGNRVTTECFCVDSFGHHIEGSKIDGLDQGSACAVKPYVCPAPNPMDFSKYPTYEDECTDDRNCLRGDKCCHNGVRKVCSKAFDPMKHVSSIDHVMMELCNDMPDTCVYGQCTGNWEKKGEACYCPNNRKGPFCGQPKSLDEKPQTVCQKKRYALEIFNASMEDYNKAKFSGTPMKVEELTGILKVLMSYIDTWDESEKDRKYMNMSMVNYHCDKDGEFNPTQCLFNIHTGRMAACFCVDKDGKELLGTRKPAWAGMPHCGSKERMCMQGHPLYRDNGDITTCQEGMGCPYNGYSCTQGVYGQLYCCPNHRHEYNVCHLPSDNGMQCMSGQAPVTLYAYDYLEKACVSFQYKGCGGNKNSFKTMEDCQKRCVQGVHLGTCPNVFKITKSKECEDSCESDSECHSDKFKCCQSSCGKHCVPSVSENPMAGKCPFGRNSQKMCSQNDQCEDGYYCHLPVNNPDMPGYCCVNVDDVNLCHVVPYLKPMYDQMGGSGMGGNDHGGSGMGGNDHGGSGMGGNDHGGTGMGGKDNEGSNMDGKDMGGKDHEGSGMGGNDHGGSDKGDKDMGGSDMGEHDVLVDHSCEDPKPRYYYNPKKKMCEKFYGCDNDFNTFETMESCCQTCSAESRCKAGKCPKTVSGLVYSCKDECSTDIDCNGNQICCSNGCAKTCQFPEVEEEEHSSCQIARMKAKQNMNSLEEGKCSIQYVPSCNDRHKTWARHQCHTSVGVCWCVTDKGNYIPNTKTHGVADCDKLESWEILMADARPQNMSSEEFEMCPNQEAIHCCNAALCYRRCRAHPEAMCRINPCGGCKAEFFDAEGMKVDCDEGLSKCEMELKDSTEKMQEHLITARMSSGMSESEESKDIEETEQFIDEMETSRIYRSEVPSKCQLKPESGNCRGFMPRWFYHPGTRQCSMFIWGMCGGNENRFRSPEECYSVCDPTENPCSKVKCGEPNPRCVLLYNPECYQSDKLCIVQAHCAMDPDVNLPRGIFVPRCMPSGSYSFKQCHGRYCWCVDSNGDYNGGLSKTSSYTDLQCEADGPTSSSEIQPQACEDGSNPRPKCMKACSHAEKVCPGQAKARCQVDLCSDSCETKFVDENGEEVQCGGDVCEAFRFDQEEHQNCKSTALCNGKGLMSCPMDVCEKTKCPNNPCAVCKVDPCNCKPYFVDMLSKERVPEKDCEYINRGVCHLKTCSMLHKMEEGRQNGIEVKTVNLPQCDDNGAYKTKQCDYYNKCYCVDEEGVRIREVFGDETCQKQDPVNKLESTLTFPGDFDKLKREGKLDAIKESLTQMLVEKLAVPREFIKVSNAYQGSIKFDVTVLKPDDAPDMVVISNNFEQTIENRDLILDTGDGELVVDPTASTLEQLSVDEDGGDDDDDDDDDDDGLSKRDIIIIAAACGAAGLALLILVVYCCCCKQRKKAETIDDTFHHQRQTQASENIYDKPDNMMFQNKGYQPENDDNYMKVRL